LTEKRGGATHHLGREKGKKDARKSHSKKEGLELSQVHRPKSGSPISLKNGKDIAERSFGLGCPGSAPRIRERGVEKNLLPK